jgi:transcriptional regulator with XRE-family HTH domain
MSMQRMQSLFSRNVKRLRLQAGFTQKSLAQRCTRYKSQIPKIENGTAKVNLSMIYTLALALEVEPATLLQEP